MGELFYGSGEEPAEIDDRQLAHVVGSRRRGFVGFVESTADGSFVAFDGRAEPIGRYATLAAAKASTATVVTPGAITPGHPQLEHALFVWATVSGAVAAVMALAAGVLAPSW